MTVSKLSVHVFSCYEAKPRRSRIESIATGRKAFRLFIDGEDTGKLLNPAAWPNSVTISERFFKSAASQNTRTPADVRQQMLVTSRADQPGYSSSRGAAGAVAALTITSQLNAQPTPLQTTMITPAVASKGTPGDAKCVTEIPGGQKYGT